MKAKSLIKSTVAVALSAALCGCMVGCGGGASSNVVDNFPKDNLDQPITEIVGGDHKTYSVSNYTVKDAIEDINTLGPDSANYKVYTVELPNSDKALCVYGVYSDNDDDDPAARGEAISNLRLVSANVNPTPENVLLYQRLFTSGFFAYDKENKSVAYSSFAAGGYESELAFTSSSDPNMHEFLGSYPELKQALDEYHSVTAGLDEEKCKDYPGLYGHNYIVLVKDNVESFFESYASTSGLCTGNGACYYRGYINPQIEELPYADFCKLFKTA